MQVSTLPHPGASSLAPAAGTGNHDKQIRTTTKIHLTFRTVMRRLLLPEGAKKVSRVAALAGFACRLASYRRALWARLGVPISERDAPDFQLNPGARFVIAACNNLIRWRLIAICPRWNRHPCGGRSAPCERNYHFVTGPPSVCHIPPRGCAASAGDR